MSKLVKIALGCWMALLPVICQASLINFSSNNFSTLTSTASWVGTDEIEFTFSSSTMPFTSEGEVIDRINDRGKDSSENTILTDVDSLLTFSFSAVIHNLRIYVADIDQGTDTFTDFSIAPDSADKELILELGTITGKKYGGNLPRDGGYGWIEWHNLNSKMVSFTWERDMNMGININQIEYNTVPAFVVPVPAAIWLFGTGLIGLIGFTKRRQAT